MRSVYYAFAAAAAVVTVASGANAAVTNLTLVDNGDSLSSFFGANVNGSFSNEYTFTVPADGFASAVVGSANVSLASGITFDMVSLNGTALTFDPVLPNQSFSFADLPVTAGVQSLVISGSGKGSYSGTVSYAPFNGDGNPQGAVPEPASWALMLGGFGMLGGAMRTSKKRRAAVTFG